MSKAGNGKRPGDSKRSAAADKEDGDGADGAAGTARSVLPIPVPIVDSIRSSVDVSFVTAFPLAAALLPLARRRLPISMTPIIDFDVQVFTDACQGGRKYMEDTFCVAFQSEVTSTACDPVPLAADSQLLTSELLSEKQAASPLHRKFVYAGIFDGHGGKEAALFARNHLLQNIVRQKDFWAQDDDAAILRAIREGFMSTHYAMLKQLEYWPTTSAGLPSTSGTTASICFIMNNKVYSGHVGDSRIILGRKNPETSMWIPHSLTEDHKPGSPEEKERIAKAGGEVINKSGVDRVVWFRPKNGHRGPIRRSTNFDKIPFLAIARSLGDLWSYNPDLDTYVVSPDPDLHVMQLNPDEDQCLILASDGLWNMLLDYEAVRLVQELREDIKPDLLKSLRHAAAKDNKNPSEVLVRYALQKWNSSRLRADNTSAITLILNTTTRVPSDPSAVLLVTDENVNQLPLPVVLPAIAGPAEYLISAVNPEVRRVPAVAKPEDDFALLSPSMQSLCKFTQSHVEAFGRSPPLTESSSPTRRFTFSAPPAVVATKDSPNPMISDSNHIYVNELPDESFEALSNSLRLNNRSEVHRVISGVTVISDFDEDSNRSDTSCNGKKNKSCSVTEALVDDVPGKESEKSDLKELLNVEKAVTETLQKLDDIMPQTVVSHTEEIENASNPNSTSQPSSSSAPAVSSSCSSKGRKRKGKWVMDSPPKKCLRSSRLTESRGMRFTRNLHKVIARVNTVANRALRTRKISFYNKH